jgi:hypothetical protein
VLDDREDRIRVNGIDRWWGRTRLAADSLWRWDADRRSPAAPKRRADGRTPSGLKPRRRSEKAPDAPSPEDGSPQRRALQAGPELHKLLACGGPAPGLIGWGVEDWESRSEARSAGTQPEVIPFGEGVLQDASG